MRLTRTSHVQAALLARSLRGTPFDRSDMTLSTGAFGANVSGVLLPKWDRDDRVKFAGNAGWGIGRYITDLGIFGGQDAAYDATTNQLRALLVSSGYIGYERQWRPRRSRARESPSSSVSGCITVYCEPSRPTVIAQTGRTCRGWVFTASNVVALAVRILITKCHSDLQRRTLYEPEPSRR